MHLATFGRRLILDEERSVSVEFPDEDLASVFKQDLGAAVRNAELLYDWLQVDHRGGERLVLGIRAGSKSIVRSQLKNDAAEELDDIARGIPGRCQIGDFVEHQFGDQLFFESRRAHLRVFGSEAFELVFHARKRGFHCTLLEASVEGVFESHVRRQMFRLDHANGAIHRAGIHEFQREIGRMMEDFVGQVVRDSGGAWLAAGEKQRHGIRMLPVVAKHGFGDLESQGQES